MLGLKKPLKCLKCSANIWSLKNAAFRPGGGVESCPACAAVCLGSRDLLDRQEDVIQENCLLWDWHVLLRTFFSWRCWNQTWPAWEAGDQSLPSAQAWAQHSVAPSARMVVFQWRLQGNIQVGKTHAGSWGLGKSAAKHLGWLGLGKVAKWNYLIFDRWLLMNNLKLWLLRLNFCRKLILPAPVSY